MERDAHNAFVHRLSTWLPAALTRRRRLQYPERLNRTGLNVLLEDLWGNRIRIADYIDHDNAQRIADLGQQYSLLFNDENVEMEQLDEWLADRFLPIAVLAEAIIRERELNSLAPVSAVRDRVALLPPVLQVMIDEMSTDPDVLEPTAGGPRIVHPRIVADATSQLSQRSQSAADDDEAVGEVLSQLSQLSTDHGRGPRSRAASRSPRRSPHRSPPPLSPNRHPSRSADRLPRDQRASPSRTGSAASASHSSSSAAPLDPRLQAFLPTGYVVPMSAVANLVNYTDDSDDSDANGPRSAGHRHGGHSQ